MSYGKLGNLSQVKVDKPTKRFIAQLLGLCYEPMPYVLVALKSYVKVALHLTSKIATILKENKKYLISLIMYMQPGLIRILSNMVLLKNFFWDLNFLK